MAQGGTDALLDRLYGPATGTDKLLDSIYGEEPPGFVETMRFPGAMAMRGLAGTAGDAAGAAMAPPQGILSGLEGLIERGVGAVIPHPFARGQAAEAAKMAVIPWQLKLAAKAREALVPEGINRAQTQLVSETPKAFRAAAQAINPPSEKVSRVLAETGPKIPIVDRTVGQVIGEDVPEAIGSTVPFLVSGGFAGAAGVGALAQAGNSYSETLEKTGDEKKAWTAFAAGIPSGATEAIDASIAGGQLSRIAKKLGGGFLMALLVNGAAEGLQEGGQQVLQDYVDSKLTGEEKDFLKSFAHAALVGSVAGGILGGPESLQAGREGKPDAEAAQRDERIGRRTEPVVRQATTTTPEIQEQVDIFASDVRKAKPPEEPDIKLVGLEGVTAKQMRPLAEAEGLRVVEPTTPAEKWAVEVGAKSGTPIVGVERTGGGRLPLSGKRTAAGILMDFNQPTESLVKAVALHELTHEVAGRTPQAFQTLYDELQSIDPEGMALSMQRARDEHARAGVPFEEGSALEAEEAVARHAETIAGYLDLRLSDPAKLTELFEKKPGLVRKIVDWLRDVLARFKLIDSSLSLRLNKLSRQISLSPEEMKVPADRARAAADVIATAYAKLSEARSPEMLQATPAQEAAQPSEAPAPSPILSSPAEAAAVEPQKKEPIAARRARKKKRGRFAVPREEAEQEIARLRREHAAALSTPLMSEGAVSPTQVNRMGTRERERWQRLAQERMTVEARIRDLKRPVEARQAEEDRAAKKERDLRLLVLRNRVGDLSRLGVGKSGKIRPTYQAEIDKAKTEIATIEAQERDSGAGPRFAVARNAEGEGFDVAAPGRADRVYAVIVSDFDRIREVEMGAKAPLQGESISRALTLMPGRIFHKQEQARERIFDAERKIIAETGMPAHVSTEKEVSASDFLYATHAPRGNKVLAADNPDLGEELNPGTGMKTSEAKALTKKALASKNAPAYRELQRLNRERNALMLDTWVEGDLVSQEKADELRERWGEDFVPLRTIEEPETLFPRVGKGLGVSGKEYKRRKGRSTKADSPLAFAEATLQQAIERAENNNIGNLLGELAEQNPDMDLRVETDRNKVAHNEEALSFKKDGEQRWLVTSDKDLAAAFKRIGPEAGTIIKGIADRINRFLRHVIIDWNFAWPFGNAAKDILTSGIKHTISTGDNIGVGAKAGAIVAANAPKAMRAAWRVLKDPEAKGYWEDRVRESRVAGGHIGWAKSFGEIKERVRSFEAAKRRAFPLRAAVAYGRLMETLGKAVEVGTRVATYDYHIKHGKNAEDAAVAMRQITTDFAVKGHWAPIYRRLYLFSGSSVQGMFGPGGVVDVLRKNPGRGATVAGALVGAGFVSALASFAFGDDDELAKLSEDDKARFQGVMVGDTRIGSLAPWGFNVFPYLGWKLAEIATGRSKATALPGQMLTAAIDSFSPLPQGANVWQSITPTALRPGMELSQNLKYSGAPIMPPENPYARAKTPAHLRKFKNVSPVFDATTTALSKVGIEVSPEALEHLFEAATGGIGTQTNRVVNVASKVIKGDADEVRLSDIPIVRSFAQQASRGSEARLFYENLTRIAEEAASRKRGESFDADALRWEKFSKVIEKQIGKLKDRLDVTKDDETKKKLEERIEFLRGRLNKAMREPVGAR